MFDRLKLGFDINVRSVQVFIKYPKLLVPLLVTWLIVAPIILYLKFFFDTDQFSATFVFSFIFLVILLFAFLLSFSCTVLLQMVRQIEEGGKPSIISALTKGFLKNTFQIMPIVIIWSIIWFVLLVISAMTRRRRGQREQLNARTAAETLAGFEDHNIFEISIGVLQDGLRVLVFLILPGIVWEGMGTGKAIKKAFAIIKAHSVEIISGYVLTELGSAMLYFPPALLIYFASSTHADLPSIVWYLVIIYCGFAWSYTMYLEQMFTTQLYMRNMIWEKQVALAQQQNKPIPSFEDVPEPDLLDDDPEFGPDNQTEYDPPVIDSANLPPSENPSIPPKMYNPNASAAEHGEERQ